MSRGHAIRARRSAGSVSVYGLGNVDHGFDPRRELFAEVAVRGCPGLSLTPS